MKTKRYIVDGVKDGHYVRASSEGTGKTRRIIVMVWKNKTTDAGLPDGSWAMPGILGNKAAIAQAIAQT